MTLNVYFQFGGAFAFRESFWTFCNLLPRIFKVFWFNKNKATIINNTFMISKSEIFGEEWIKFSLWYLHC